MSSKDKPAAGQQPENQTSNEEEDELVVIETDSKGQPINQQVADDHDEPDDDDDDAGDDDHDEDERRGHAEGDQDDNAPAGETIEERRDRRKRERRAKSIRNRVANQTRERLIQQQAETIHDLTARVNRLEGRTTRSDINHLRQVLQNIESQQQDAKRTHAELAKTGDWEGVAEVNEIQLTLREQHRNVQIALQRATEEAKRGNGADDEPGDDNTRQPRQQSRKNQPDPVVTAKANEWADQHSWLRDRATDPEDVAIVRGIDQVLAREGISPRTDEYWAELTKRVKRRLPQYFQTRGERSVDSDRGGNKPAARGPKMTPASQTGSRRPLKPNEVRISPERKKAMQDAGIWDDPVKRNAQLKAYQKWDRENAADNQ